MHAYAIHTSNKYSCHGTIILLKYVPLTPLPCGAWRSWRWNSPRTASSPPGRPDLSSWPAPGKNASHVTTTLEGFYILLIALSGTTAAISGSLSISMASASILGFFAAFASSCIPSSASDNFACRYGEVHWGGVQITLYGANDTDRLQAVLRNSCCHCIVLYLLHDSLSFTWIFVHLFRWWHWRDKSWVLLQRFHLPDYENSKVKPIIDVCIIVIFLTWWTPDLASVSVPRA